MTLASTAAASRRHQGLYFVPVLISTYALRSAEPGVFKRFARAIVCEDGEERVDADTNAEDHGVGLRQFAQRLTLNPQMEVGFSFPGYERSVGRIALVARLDGPIKSFKDSVWLLS